MKKFFATICAATLLLAGCGTDKPAPTQKPASNKIDLFEAQVAVKAIRTYPAQLVETVKRAVAEASE